MYKVEIQYRKGSYLTYNNVVADSKDEAKEKALKSAIMEGFKEKIKKVIISETV